MRIQTGFEAFLAPEFYSARLRRKLLKSVGFTKNPFTPALCPLDAGRVMLRYVYHTGAALYDLSLHMHGLKEPATLAGPFCQCLFGYTMFLVLLVFLCWTQQHWPWEQRNSEGESSRVEWPGALPPEFWFEPGRWLAVGQPARISVPSFVKWG